MKMISWKTTHPSIKSRFFFLNVLWKGQNFEKEDFIYFFFSYISISPKKNMCIYNCMVFKFRVSRSGFLIFFFETYKYAPSSKITQTCLFLSYYSLLIIWHAVQCFWFQTSIKVQGNEENCWSRKQTRKQRRISGFCRYTFFFLVWTMLGSAVKF